MLCVFYAKFRWQKSKIEKKSKRRGERGRGFDRVRNEEREREREGEREREICTKIKATEKFAEILSLFVHGYL